MEYSVYILLPLGVGLLIFLSALPEILKRRSADKVLISNNQLEIEKQKTERVRLENLNRSA